MPRDNVRPPIFRRRVPAAPAVILAALSLLATPVAWGQAGGSVRAGERDVNVIVGGNAYLDAFRLDGFFRDDGRSSRGWDVIAARFDLDVDFRFTTTAGVHISVATERRKRNPGLPIDDYPRTRGFLMGTENPNVVLDEAYLQLQRLFDLELTVTVGIRHVELGLDTSEEALVGSGDFWEGHGRIFVDTRHGLPDPRTTQFIPAGIAVTFKDLQLGEELNAGTAGYFVSLYRDPADDTQSLWLAAFEPRLQLTQLLTFVLGYARIFDQSGPDVESIWVGIEAKVERTMRLYGEGVFNLGNGNSGSAIYFGGRYTLPNQVGLLDVSYWIISGDNPDTSGKNEGYLGISSLRTLLAVDSIDYGIGRQTNYTALKIVAMYQLSQQMQAKLGFGHYTAQRSATAGQPGGEIDVFLILRPAPRTRIEAGFAFLFDSKVYGSGGAPDGWIFGAMVTSEF
jgi:hypothetical protein